MARKTKAELEQEYQDVLKVSNSLLGDINKMISKNEEKMKDMSKAGKEFNSTAKEILGQTEEYSDIADNILKIQAAEDKYNASINKKLNDKRRTQKGSLGTLKAEQKNQNKIYDIGKKALRTEQARGEAILQVDNAAQGLADSLSGGLDNIMGSFDDIPVIGGMISNMASGPVESLKGSFGEAATRFTSTFGNALKGGKGGMEALRMAGGSSMKFLAAAVNPVTIAIVAVVAVIALGISAFTKLAAAAKVFREETGLLNSQTKGLQSNISSVYANTSKLGASMEDVAKAGADFTNVFDGVEQPSAAVLENMVVLNKNFGIATQTGAEVTKLFRNMSGLSAEAAQNQTALVAEASKLAGVAPQKVMSDIAANTETAYQFFGGSVSELSKAAIQAAKMGTSISAMADTAKGLLDFESSINSELEASALIGQSVNFNRARELAAAGDLVGMQRAVMDQLEGIGDISEMNYYQQQKIAEASGMTVDEIKKQQKIRSQLGKLGDEELAAANALLDSGQELSSSNLAAKTKELAQQQEMQSKVDQMKNTWSAMTSAISTAFAPIGEVFMDIMNIVGKILLPAFKVIGKLINLAFTPLKVVFGAIMSMLNPILDAFSGMFDELDPYFSKMDDLFSTISSVLNPIFSVIGTVLSSTFKIIGGIIGVLIDVFGFLITPLIDGFTWIGGIINDYLIEPVMSLYNSVADFFSGIGSWFSGGGEEVEAEQSQEAEQLQVAGSIDDGIVQNGNIISTDPEDTLVATKTPGSLFGDMMGATPLGMAANAIGGMFGGGGGSNQELLAKMDILIEAVRQSGNISMDGKSVTDGVKKVVEKSTSNSFGLV